MACQIATIHITSSLNILPCRSCTFSYRPSLPMNWHSREIFQSHSLVPTLRYTVSISTTKVRQMKHNMIVHSLTQNECIFNFIEFYPTDPTLRAVSHHGVLRRSADHARKSYKSHDSPTNEHTALPVLAVGAAVVSLIVLVVLVALCAGSSTYEPKAKGEVTLQK